MAKAMCPSHFGAHEGSVRESQEPGRSWCRFRDVSQNSQCPSAKQGGNLGELSPGQMVREFDEVVFGNEVGKVHGPIKTQFGYHLIEITSRTA